MTTDPSSHPQVTRTWPPSSLSPAPVPTPHLERGEGAFLGPGSCDMHMDGDSVQLLGPGPKGKEVCPSLLEVSRGQTLLQA